MNKTLWEKARIQTFIYSAIDYTTMVRVFEPGSSKEIHQKLQKMLFRMTSVPYEKLHREFCHWFEGNIKRKRNHQPASYGEAAKTLDVAMKFLVGFCQLPNKRAAKMLMPKLHCGIDRMFLRHLKSKCSSLVNLDKLEYKKLQRQLNQEASGELPVVYDEVLRQKLLQG